MLVPLVYARQHKCLGHVLHIDNESTANIILQEKVDDTRRRDNPRTTWMSAIKKKRSLTELHRAIHFSRRLKLTSD